MRKAFLSILCLPLLMSAASAAPKVLATIKPIHSLAAAVMQGVAEPELLIGGALSEHSYALKPSDARKIEGADVIIEVGPDLETYLQAPLQALGGHAKILVLERVPGMHLLPARHGGLWEGDEDDHGPTDPHIWLDPENSIAMTRAIAETLARRDPSHAAAYRANAVREVAMITALDKELRATLAPLGNKPYLVFHDAYHYFEARYGLHPAGSVTVAPDRPVGARRVAELHDAVASGRIICLFREPQFPPKLIETLDEGTRARVGVLDPLGADLTPGPNLYPQLMRNLARGLTACLARNR
ncbi:MAG: zinc ABC transporter substrate-binding protein [Alphaproteobacteria bacterium]|nr:zinc ABC transporter substrate-binding protein [Alphaproteobacteria bacterium]